MAAAPTYTRKPVPVVPGPQDNLGGQVVDGNRITVQGLASGIITTDISASPITSPTSLTTAVTTITCPISAIRVIISNLDATNNVLISELVGMSTYFTLLPKTSQQFDIGRQGFIYLKSSTGTVSCSFAFELVD